MSGIKVSLVAALQRHPSTVLESGFEFKSQLYLVLLLFQICSIIWSFSSEFLSKCSNFLFIKKCLHQ